MDKSNVPKRNPPGNEFAATVARIAANYILVSRAFPSPRDAAPPFEGIHSYVARAYAGAYRRGLWDLARHQPGGAAWVERVAVRDLRRPAKAAVHPRMRPALAAAFRDRANREPGSSAREIRRRWLDRAALEALGHRGPPPGALAAEWYRAWTNRVGYVLRRELLGGESSREQDVDEERERERLARQVVAEFEAQDPLDADRALLAYLYKAELTDEERELVDVMSFVGPNTAAAARELEWGYWRARRVFKLVRVKARKARAVGL